MESFANDDKTYEWILDSLATGIFTVNHDFVITYFNAQAENLTGYSKDEALGRKCWEVFRTDHCHNHCNLKRAMETDSKIVNIRLVMRNRRKQEVPVAITAAVLHDRHGKILGGVESFQDDRARQALEKEVRGSYTLEDFISRDEAVQAQLSRLPVMAKSAKPMLILGETGVGKDILARIIHNMSNRKQGPFIKVNCAAIPSTMLESELLGYKKGAFTDAKTDKPGKFLLAQNGTILLDEIGELGFDMQAKILQVIEDKEYYPLGATEMEWVNARILASTNCDLDRMISENRFRKDLYYRLKMFEFFIPPLRDRARDIPLLIDHFLSEAAAIQNREKPDIEPGAWKVLLNYDYPGNIRECKNIIEYALMVCQQSVTRSDLPHYLLQNALGRSEDLAEPPTGEISLEHSECLALQRCLREHDWNIQKTASSLGINRTTLWRKMKKHGLAKKRRKPD